MLFGSGGNSILEPDCTISNALTPFKSAVAGAAIANFLIPPAATDADKSAS